MKYIGKLERSYNGAQEYSKGIFRARRLWRAEGQRPALYEALYRSYIGPTIVCEPYTWVNFSQFYVCFSTCLYTNVT